MNISIFTSSHNPQYLDQAYESLVAQTDADWEWLVLLNNGAKWRVPDPEDYRVRVIECQSYDMGVGFYKRLAANNCTGDVLIELDHDDMLMPEAVESVREAFEISDNIVFAYSDFAQINADGTPNFDEFDHNYGWSYKDEDGHHVCHSFPPYPHNIGYIWYAPNHLRAFRKTAYKDAGGYNPSMRVLDDQALMYHLFRQGEFYFIKQNLYLQRVHKEQTQAQSELNAQIQVQTVELYDQSIQDMAMIWAKRRGLKCLDLGAAHGKPVGYEGVDIYSGAGVDYVGDFLKLDLPDDSVGVIRAVDFLEHVPDKVAVMNKIWRLLAHGGMLLSLTPSTDGRAAFQDPTHVAFYNENSFWYYTNEAHRKFVPEIEAEFHPSRVATIYLSDWHRANQMPYVQANLVAIKGFFNDFGGLKNL